MSSPHQVPVALRVVAILFLIGGLGSAVDVVMALYKGELYLNPGVLGIPTYFGLRAFSPGWRTWALVSLWLGLIGASVAFVVGLLGGLPAKFDLFGWRIAELPPYSMSIVAVATSALLLWQYRVLTRPDIRRLFEVQAPYTTV